MRQPLLLDMLEFFLPLLAGALAFQAGRTIRSWRKAFRIGFAIFTTAVIVGGTALAFLLPDDAAPVFARLGGPTVLLSWIALLLLAIVWRVPGRSFSTGFLASIAVLAGCLIAIESSGRLWWRFGNPQAWRRVPNAEGLLQQSSGLSCSPTAAAMLLHRYGISSSEGEMAYLARTSFFGTDAYSIARALQMKAKPHDCDVCVQHLNYVECIRLNAAFIAHINGENTGHAVLVVYADSDQVEVFDPAEGISRVISRSKFEQVWDGTAIYLIRNSH